MSLRLRSFGFYVRFWHYILPLAAFALATYVRIGPLGCISCPGSLDPRFYVAILGLITMVWAIAVERLRLCDTDELFRKNTGIRRSVSACVTTYTVLLVVLFFYREQNFSHIFFVVSSVALLIMTLLTRVVLRLLLHTGRNGRPAISILMVGTDYRAKRIAASLASVPLVTSKVVGYVRAGDEEIQVDDAPVFTFEDITHGKVPRFEEVVIAVAPNQLSQMDDPLVRIARLCVPVRVVLDLGSVHVVPDRLFQLGDLQMVDLASTPLESPAYFFLKRVFDVAFSALVLLFGAGLMVVIALAIKLTSPGPVLFRQERVGLNGRSFHIYKFRTMRSASLAESNSRWTVKDDPRVTRIGRFLRKTSMDELPQFLNVIKGDMSVVGPRPERPHFVRRFLEEVSHYDSRHRLKVGITGWAQVNGWRGDTSIAKRFEYDLYYLQHWSFWFDLRIIVLTAWSGMFGKNAY